MTMKFVVTGMPGRQLVQDVALGDEVGEQLVGGEPAEVELLRRVGEGGGRARRQHLVEVGVALRPERRPPGVVEPVDGRRTGGAARPGTPPRSRRSSRARCGSPARCRRARAGARGCAAYRSADARGTAPARARGRPASSGRSPAGRRATAGCRRRAAAASRGAGRSATAAATPWRWPGRCRCRRAASRSRTSSSQPKRYSPGADLEVRPGEDADGDQVDAGLQHQPDVLVPDLAWATARGCSHRRTPAAAAPGRSGAAVRAGC